MATKKITLDTLATLITALGTRIEKGFAASDKTITGLDARVEKGFAAVADDIADMRRDTATKEQLFALQTQVTSIETQVRGMNYGKLETRIANLEDKVFGATRS